MITVMPSPATPLTSTSIAELAVAAICAEADLTRHRRRSRLGGQRQQRDPDRVKRTASALQKAADAARVAGAFNYERLNVPVASHCPKQATTARQLAAHLADLPRRQPTARYLTNTRGRATTSADTVLDDLAQAVAHTVQWYDATRLMGELGATCAVEIQPGHVLTRLLPSAAPTIAAISLQDNGLTAATRRANRLLDTEDRPSELA